MMMRPAFLVLAIALLLAGCNAASSEQPRTNLDALEQQAASLPRGEALTEQVRLQQPIAEFGLVVPADIQRYPLPTGWQILGHLEGGTCYARSADASKLGIISLEDAGDERLIVAAETNSDIADAFAFSDRYLVWVELGPWQSADDRIDHRRCRLMLHDLAQGETKQLESGTITRHDFPALPFDHLNLEGDSLAYRYSRFDGGWRTTQIRLQDLATGDTRILAEARPQDGRMILSCHMRDRLLVWDLRSSYQHKEAHLPAQTYAVYDLYGYQLDGRSSEAALQQLTRNDDLFAPHLYRQQILAVRHIDDSNERDSELVEISPMMKTISPLLSAATPFSIDSLAEYESLKLRRGSPVHNPLRIHSWREPYIDRRYISWASNIADKHILYDTAASRYVRIPDAYLRDDDHPLDATAPSFWLRPLPSLDADAYMLGFTDRQDGRYLLVLR